MILQIKTYEPKMSYLGSKQFSCERAERKTYFLNLLRNSFHRVASFCHWTTLSYMYSTPYEAHLKNQRVASVKKEQNAVKSQMVIYICFKSQKLLIGNLHEMPLIQNIQ